MCIWEYDFYCVFDGVIYFNKCVLEVFECESGKDLDILYFGECKGW